MADVRRGFGGDGAGNDRLPWLEPVEDEDDVPERRDGGRTALWLVAALVLAALLFGGFVLWQRHRAAYADIGAIIHAPPGPYKVRPARPGGLAVNEQDVIASRMGTGNDINSPLDLSRMPEQPVAGPGSDQPAPAATPTPAATPASAPTHPAMPPPRAVPPAAVPAVASAPLVKAPASKPVPAPVTAAKPAVPVPSTGGGTIQLGALASEAKAKQVWKSLSTRFGFLAPLTMSVTPVQVGDATLYRLRASGGDARRLCAQLKVAGESCNVVE